MFLFYLQYKSPFNGSSEIPFEPLSFGLLFLTNYIAASKSNIANRSSFIIFCQLSKFKTNRIVSFSFERTVQSVSSLRKIWILSINQSNVKIVIVAQLVQRGKFLEESFGTYVNETGKITSFNTATRNKRSTMNFYSGSVEGIVNFDIRCATFTFYTFTLITSLKIVYNAKLAFLNRSLCSLHDF